MAKIEFPRLLDDLLKGSCLLGPIRLLTDRVEEILSDNKLPFFPNYTDHGIAHINAVLKAEIELIPDHVRNRNTSDAQSPLLCDADAAVIIGATLLHDIAMHLQPLGLLELIGVESRFKPLPWFKDSHEGHFADLPWHDLWDSYQREARRFSDRDLASIIGEESSKQWKFNGLPSDPGLWRVNDNLVVGEFIRRHHARLAHEIAVYGFPGLPIGSGEGCFPAMGKESENSLNKYADLIGLTARSHGTSLRVCKAYLDTATSYSGTPRPMGTAALYPMALLRVADYLQIDRERAPAVLLQLRDPQSPISLQEWHKHRAVLKIGPSVDPQGKMVTVSTDVSLSLYLQLKELLTGLQAEIDHSTAVLGEAYGTLTSLGMHDLNLAIRRVNSNLDLPAFRQGLPYVPSRTGFTADPNLLTLLVEPLYGNHPGVGVRELLQNAVDAVRELEAWCRVREVSRDSLELSEQEGDVLIEFRKRENGTWFLSVQDRGIGMQSETIQKFFLRAGASFRRSPEWAKEFLDEQGRPRVLRAGRFGIGVFAIFLLGPSFRMWTRHAGDDDSTGYCVEATATSQLIEIRRVIGLPIGTKIEVELSSASVASLMLELGTTVIGYIDWFCWDWPIVVSRVRRGQRSERLRQMFVCPLWNSKRPAEWSVIRPTGFDAVYWTFGDYPTLSCNGLKIANPNTNVIKRKVKRDEPTVTQLKSPCVAVLDSSANLPLTTQRYELSQDVLPFAGELDRDVTLSFIAHLLVCGPTSQQAAILSHCGHPLRHPQVSRYHSDGKTEGAFADGLLRWVATPFAVVPTDPWLYSLLDADSCLLYGAWGLDDDRFLVSGRGPIEMLPQADNGKIAILPWHATVRNRNGFPVPEKAHRQVNRFLSMMVSDGVRSLGGPAVSNVLVSMDSSFEPFESDGTFWSEVPQGNPLSRWFQARTGHLKSTIELERILTVWEASLPSLPQRLDRRLQSPCDSRRDGILFIAEVQPARVNTPTSLIAQIWSECIGAKAVPFDSATRQALIIEARDHSELRSHIDAWIEMKQAGSKWAKDQNQQT